MRAVAPFLAHDWGVERVDPHPARPAVRHRRPGERDRPPGALRRVRLLLTSLAVRQM